MTELNSNGSWMNGDGSFELRNSKRSNAMQSRRKFFQLAFGAGSVAALGLSGLTRRGGMSGVAFADDTPAAGLKLAKRSSFALGAEISMIAMHANEETARKALDAAFDELEKVESVMSIYRPK